MGCFRSKTRGLFWPVTINVLGKQRCNLCLFSAQFFSRCAPCLPSLVRFGLIPNHRRGAFVSLPPFLGAPFSGGAPFFISCPSLLPSLVALPREPAPPCWAVVTFGPVVRVVVLGFREFKSAIVRGVVGVRLALGLRGVVVFGC